MYDSLIWSRMQFFAMLLYSNGVDLPNYKKRAARIITNSKYDAHTETLFEYFILKK